MTGLVIVTAAGITVQQINQLLLHIRDWEFGDDPMWDMFKLCFNKEDFVQAVERNNDDGTWQETSVDIPPLNEAPTHHDFANMSTPDVEAFAISLAKKGGQDGHDSTLFLILDDKGLQDGTIVVAHRATDLESKDFKYLDRFDKVRVPWQEAYIMWCNLDIANMDFDSYCDDERGADKDGWWVYRPIEPEEYYAPIAQKRQQVLKELEKLNLA